MELLKPASTIPGSRATIQFNRLFPQTVRAGWNDTRDGDKMTMVHGCIYGGMTAYTSHNARVRRTDQVRGVRCTSKDELLYV